MLALRALRFRTIIRYNSSKVNIEKLEEESASVDVIDDEMLLKEQEIEKKRNKSRLRSQDRSILLEQNPYPEPQMWFHGTLKYNRRVYGRYGSESGVDPSICWPVKAELDDAKEYERVAYPFTIQEVVKKDQEEKAAKVERIKLRQEQIAEKLGKLDGWLLDLQQRIEKKEKEANAAKERKGRLIEEVRRHFGFTVDPKDERFKEMLEKKEKEQKKQMKEARKKAKEAEMLDKILKKKAKEPDNSEKQTT